MKLIKRLFVILYPIVFIFLVIEALTFKYFLFKHFFINTDLLMGVVFVSIIVTLTSRTSDSKLYLDSLINTYLFLSKLVLICISAFYFLLNFVEEHNYKNYVYSHYHIQPQLILRPIILISFFLIAYLVRDKIVFLNNIKSYEPKKNYINSILAFALAVILAVFCIGNLFEDVSLLSKYFLDFMKTASMSKEEKYKYVMRSKYGYYFDYMEFVKSVVPTSSSILLPPQKNPWQLEGNQRLDRYFLYPRVLYSQYDQHLSNEYDYVLITWGNDSFPLAPNDTYGWPRYDIEAKKVYIYDTHTRTYQIFDGNYEYERYLKNGVYGIVKR